MHQLLTDVHHVVSAIDMQAIDQLLTETEVIAKQSSAVISSAGEALAGINQLDFASLNTAIISLKNTANGLAELDIGMLNEAIENLNSTVAPLAKFVERFL